MLTSWFEVIPAVEAVISHRFPHLGDQRCHDLAEQFYDEWSADVALQQIERADKLPDKDVGELKKLANDLRKAASRVSKLGWHGAIALQPLASDILPEEYRPRFRHAGLDAPGRIAAYLQMLERACAEAAKNIPKDAGSPMEKLGGTRLESRPPDRAASSAVLHLAPIFELATGQPPRRRSDPHRNGKEYGPFRELVVAIFNALEIDAKPDHHIRNVTSDAKSP